MVVGSVRIRKRLYVSSSTISDTAYFLRRSKEHHTILCSKVWIKVLVDVENFQSYKGAGSGENLNK